MSWLAASFGNAWLWPLLLAALLPWLLHLLDRRRARRVDWPAVRFFLTGSRRKLRRLVLREYVLIALRGVAVLFFVLALLRPRGSAVVEGAPAGPRGVVVVVDTSFSMAYRETPSSTRRLAAARRSARELLADLESRDLVYLVVAPPSASPPDLAPLDPGTARQRLRELRHHPEPFDLLEALDAAVRLSADLPTPRREIHVFTDLQATSSPSLPPGKRRLLRSRLAEQSPRPTISIVDCGQEETTNRTVSRLTVPDLAVAIDEPVELRCELTVWGESPGPLLVRIHVDGELVAQESVEVAGDGRARLAVKHRFRTPGWKEVRVSLPADRLPEDDSRHVVLPVRERIDVLLVETPSGPRNRESGQRFYQAAWPRVPGMETPQSVLRPRRVHSLAGGTGGADVVVLADLPGFSPREAALLESHLKEGGGIIVFCGEAVDADLYNERFFRGGRGFLPVQLTERSRVPRSRPLHPVDVDLLHPVLDVFAGAEQGDLELVEVYAHWKTGARAPGVKVLAAVGSDTPWLLERRYGKGRTLLLGSSAVEDDSDLPLTPLFPPLVHRLVKYAAGGRDAPRSRLVGERLRWTLPPRLVDPGPTPELFVRDPSGAQHEIRLGTSSGEPLVAEFQDPAEPGFYRLEVRGEPALRIPRAVNLPAAESRLQRIDPGELSALEATLGIRHREVGSPPTLSREERRIDVEYWPHAAWAALILLFGELILLRSFAPSSPPPAAPRRAAVSKVGGPS